MTKVEQNLADAQEALRRAEQDVQRSKDAAAELPPLREQGRAVRAELLKAERDIEQADKDWAVAEQDVTLRNRAIQEHHARKPKDFPSDAELATWDQQFQKLTAHRDEACARKGEADRARIESRQRAVALDRQLTGLRNREAQLERLAAGELPGDWLTEGSVRPVR